MKRFITFVLALVLTIACVQIPVEAAWQQKGGSWYYTDASGKNVTGWKQVGGTWYYFNSQGVMQTGWLLSGKDWYYLNSSGAMVTGTVTIGGVKHKFNSSGIWLGEEQAAKNGWVSESGKWFYYNNGTKATGWKQVGGVWYYFNNQGVMQTGWLLSGKDWYYLNGSGAMVTGTVTIGGVKHKFNSSGIWLGEEQAAKNGWIAEGGKWFYYTNGAKATGWKQVGSTWYYFNSQGVMQTGWLLYGGAWYYLKASGEMATGWLLDGKAWYYMNASGVMVTGWQEIGTDTYYFYDSGMMATNTVVDGITIGEDGKAQKNSGDDQADPPAPPATATITIGIPVSALVSDYDTNALTQWLEEKTGYDVEFQLFQPGDVQSTLSVMIAAQAELPDILLGFNLHSSTSNRYGQEGYFADLTPYFLDTDGASVEFWNRMNTCLTQDERDQVMGTIYDRQSGGIYSVPTVTTQTFNTNCMAWINQEWLDVLELEMPTNVSELYEVLVAFANQDPNGNGKADEIPLLGAERMPGGVVAEWLLNMYLYYDSSSLWQPDANGNLQPVFTQDSYRQALMFIRRLTREGLLGNMSFSMGGAEMKMLLSSNTPVGIIVANMSSLAQQGVSSEILYKYEPMVNWGYTVEKDITCKGNNFITADCDDVSAAFKVLMTLFSEEGTLRMAYGEYGVDWTDEDVWGGNYLGVNSNVEILQDVTENMNNRWWATQACGIYDYDGSAAVYQDWNTDEEAWLQDNLSRGVNAITWSVYNMTPANACPKLYLDEDMTVIHSDVMTVVDSTRQQFITGQADPANDAKWNEYLQELERLELSELTAATQLAYNDQADCIGKDHLYANATCTVAKTCIYCAQTQGQPKGHSFDGQECSSCGKEAPSLTGSVWGTLLGGGDEQIAVPKLTFDENGKCFISITYYNPFSTSYSEELAFELYYDMVVVNGQLCWQVPSGTGRDGTYTVNGNVVTMNFYGEVIELTKMSESSYKVTNAGESYLSVGDILTAQ